MRRPVIVKGGLLALGLLSLAAGPAGAGSRTNLRELVLGAASVPYSGRLKFSHWNGAERVVEEAQVYFDPPGRYLEEFIDASGKTVRLAVSDGIQDQVYALKRGRLAASSLAVSREESADAARRWRLLLSNYRVRVSGSRTAAGNRPSWIVELRPKSDGKPWQTLLVDKETGIILLNRRYLPGTDHSSALSFTTFIPGGRPDPALFQIEARSAPPKTPPQLQPRAAPELVLDGAFPPRLAAGFVLESQSGFQFPGSSWVRHARYTDGLAFLSVFQTDRPVAVPHGGARGGAPLSTATDALSLLDFTTTLQFTRSGRHYLIVGDTSPALLASLARSIPN